MAEFDGVNVPEGIASLLREDKEIEKRFNTDPDFPVETNRAMILYNDKGEGTFVKGESHNLIR